MKKLQMGSAEILGYIGIAVWVAVILLRGQPMPASGPVAFWMGILPNLGAAWVVTMFARWVVVLLLKKEVTARIHLLICAGVLILALLSEIVHDLFLNSPFDMNDILITIAAQIVAFFLPLVTRKPANPNPGREG